MTPFPELAASREYWLTKIQNDLYNCVEDYLIQQGWTRTQLAEHLGVTKGYVSQVLNGDFDHKLSKLIDLSLAVGMAPNIQFQELGQYVSDYLSEPTFYDMPESDSESIKLLPSNAVGEYHYLASMEQQVSTPAGQVVDNGMFISFNAQAA